jgi:hypothetical protein
MGPMAAEVLLGWHYPSLQPSTMERLGPPGQVNSPDACLYAPASALGFPPCAEVKEGMGLSKVLDANAKERKGTIFKTPY